MGLATAKGNLAIVDLTTVFWKGQRIEGVEAVWLHADEDTQMLKIRVRDGVETLLAEMEAAGIKIRRV